MSLKNRLDRFEHRRGGACRDGAFALLSYRAGEPVPVPPRCPRCGGTHALYLCWDEGFFASPLSGPGTEGERR
jgi:hypothetical protein